MDDLILTTDPGEPERDNAPALPELYSRAESGGFAFQFADLRAAEFEQRRVVDGAAVMQARRLSPRQAWFVAWFGADERVREPKSLADVARFLNVSRQTLYKWQAADWFDLTGVRTWERKFVASHVPALYRKLMANALTEDGAVSNAAIKLALEVWQRHSDPAPPAGPTTAVQVNVNGQAVEVSARERLAERLAQLRGGNE